MGDISISIYRQYLLSTGPTPSSFFSVSIIGDTAVQKRAPLQLPAGECGGSELQHCSEGGHCGQGPQGAGGGQVVDCGLGHVALVMVWEVWPLGASVEFGENCILFERGTRYC